jgi:hypothetical protein
MSKKVNKGPIRRDVARLIRELCSGHCPAAGSLLDKAQECGRLRDEREKRLLEDAKYRALKIKTDLAYSAYYAAGRKIEEEARRIRVSFLANGMSRSVMQRLRALVAKANRCP